MTNAETTQNPQAVGARINPGQWMEQFAVTGAVKCTSGDCEPWSRTLPHGTDGLELWHLMQAHMFERHLSLAEADLLPADQSEPDAVTVLPAEDYDRLIASLDDPPVPNEPTREAFRRLNEVVTRRPGLEGGEL